MAIEGEKDGEYIVLNSEGGVITQDEFDGTIASLESDTLEIRYFKDVSRQIRIKISKSLGEKRVYSKDIWLNKGEQTEVSFVIKALDFKIGSLVKFNDSEVGTVLGIDKKEGHPIIEIEYSDRILEVTIEHWDSISLAEWDAVL